MPQSRFYSDKFVRTTILNGSGLTSTDTQLAVANPSGAPSSFPFELILSPDTSSVEVVLVTSGSGTILSPWNITRGYGNSMAVSHSFGADVIHGASSQDFTDSRVHEITALGVHGGGHVNGLFNPLEYGAVGDGATDDTVAIQAAITAMPAEGGILYFPAAKTFNFNTTLDFTAKGNVIIRGHGSRSAGATVPTTRVRYTGGSGSGFNFQALNSVSIEDIQITYQGGSYSGTVLNFNGSSTSVLTNNISMYNVSCYGAGGSTSATWVSLDNVTHVNIVNCEFVSAHVGVVGKSVNGNISRSVLIEGCRFVGCDSAIKNPGRGWTVTNCSADVGVTPVASFVSHDAGVLCNGLNITGNRTDTSATSGTQFTLAGKSIRVATNYISVPGGTGVNVDELSNGIVIENNSFETMTTGITFGAFAHTGQRILDNTFVSVTTPLGGTALTDGAISDVTGQVKVTGTLTSSKALYSGTVALTDAATIATDASLGNEFTVTLGGNRTMGAPTNPVDGQVITYRIRQDGVGSRTLSWNSAFRFNDPFSTPVLQTVATAIDLFQFIYNAGDSKWDILDSAQLNLSFGTVTALSAGTISTTGNIGGGGNISAVGSLKFGVSALTDGATINTNANLGNLFTVTLGGNRTIAPPTNAGVGQIITYAISQDGTGGRTLTWSSASGGFDFSSSPWGTPILNSAINTVSYISFLYDVSISKWRPLDPNVGNSSFPGTVAIASALTVSAGGAAIAGNSTVTGTLTSTKAMYPGVSTLTDAATIVTDASLGNVFDVTLGGNRTVGAPTNSVNGQTILYRIRQDGTGSRTLTWNSAFRFTLVATPTLQTAAASTDYVMFVYNSTDSKWDCILAAGTTSFTNITVTNTLTVSNGGSSLVTGNWIDYSGSFAWTATSVNPTFGGTGGVSKARYKYLDLHTVVYNVYWQPGNTSTKGAGNYLFSLPVAAQDSIGYGLQDIATYNNSTVAATIAVVEFVDTTHLHLLKADLTVWDASTVASDTTFRSSWIRFNLIYAV